MYRRAGGRGLGVWMKYGGFPARRGPRAPGRDTQFESEIQREIRLAAGRAVPGCVLWRNNCGVAEQRDGSFVRYGVGGKGGSDLLGILTLASGVGVWIAVEVKTPVGRLSLEQRQFGELVERCGGVFLVPRSVDEFVEQATAARARLEARS